MRQMKRRQQQKLKLMKVTTAKNAIDQATNNAGVDTAKTNGVDSINNVQPTVVKKDKKTAIENAARAKKRKSIKRLMRQMKKRWQQKRKSMRQ